MSEENQAVAQNSESSESSETSLSDMRTQMEGLSNVVNELKNNNQVVINALADLKKNYESTTEVPQQETAKEKIDKAVEQEGPAYTAEEELAARKLLEDRGIKMQEAVEMEQSLKAKFEGKSRNEQYFHLMADLINLKKANQEKDQKINEIMGAIPNAAANTRDPSLPSTIKTDQGARIFKKIQLQYNSTRSKENQEAKMLREAALEPFIKRQEYLNELQKFAK